MLYGVSYELFWHLNPTKLVPFRKTYEKKIEMQDMVSWQTGRYVMEAIGACFSKECKYPQTPYSKQKDQVQLTDAEKFAMFAAKHNAQMNRK